MVPFSVTGDLVTPLEAAHILVQPKVNMGFSGGVMANMKTGVRSTLLATVAAALVTISGMPLVAQDAAGLYKTKCSACHGADGKGDTAMGKKMGLRDFASPEVQKMSDDELTAAIADGKNKMPSYKKSLKPEQVKDLVGYIRSLAKK
jgi:mono/diheme cytochrome c family protein